MATEPSFDVLTSLGKLTASPITWLEGIPPSDSGRICTLTGISLSFDWKYSLTPVKIRSPSNWNDSPRGSTNLAEIKVVLIISVTVTSLEAAV